MANTSLEISLSEALRAYLEQRVAEEPYRTPSEYVGDLIHADQKRRAKEQLDPLLLEGLHSGPEEVDPDRLADLRRDVAEVIAKTRARRP